MIFSERKYSKFHGHSQRSEIWNVNNVCNIHIEPFYQFHVILNCSEYSLFLQDTHCNFGIFLLTSRATHMCVYGLHGVHIHASLNFIRYTHTHIHINFQFAMLSTYVLWHELMAYETEFRFIEKPKINWRTDHLPSKKHDKKRKLITERRQKKRKRMRGKKYGNNRLHRWDFHANMHRIIMWNTDPLSPSRFCVHTIDNVK